MACILADERRSVVPVGQDSAAGWGRRFRGSSSESATEGGSGVLSVGMVNM